MQATWTVVRRDLINIIKNPVLMISNMALPLILTALLGYLNRGSYGNAGVTAWDFYGITMILYAILNVAMTAGNSFMEKNLKASNMRVMFSPVSRHSIYLAKITATFLFTSACMLVNLLLVHLIFGVSAGGHLAWAVVLVLLAFDLATSSLGVMACCLFHSEEQANQISSIVINIFAILGGVFFRLDGYGEFVRTLTWLSPVRWISEAVFRTIWDGNTSLVMPVTLCLLLAAAAMCGLCAMTFRTEDYV